MRNLVVNKSFRRDVFRILGLILFILIIFSCEEKPKPPSVTTKTVTEILFTTATSGGEVTNEGGSEITSRGVCWSSSSEPTISSSKTIEVGGVGEFTSILTQLIPNTLYYVRAFASSTAGTSYGNQITFTTLKVEPATLTTTEITQITQTTAVSGGNISSENGGTVSIRGICWGKNPYPTTINNKTTDGVGVGVFTSTLSGLDGNTTYYVRAYAVNSSGTAYGNQVVFKTSPATPTLTTIPVTKISKSSAVSGGNISNDGGAKILSRGICWGTSSIPTIEDSFTIDGEGLGIFESSITGLTTGTLYRVRAYATNSAGTSYGNMVSFTSVGTIQDIDGNSYNTVTIGSQIWMAENLKTTRYNNGDSIPVLSENISWGRATSGALCYYNNDYNTYGEVYGALYNFFAVIDNRKLCPIGWHVPTDAEWTSLANILGGYEIAGGKLKETGTLHWLNTHVGVTNETGFTALPGGYRNSFYQVFFYDIRMFGDWWTSTEVNSDNAWTREINTNDNKIAWYSEIKNLGASVRCIKDN